MQKCLVIGGNGFVGKYIKEIFAQEYDVILSDIYLGSDIDEHVDITNFESVKDVIGKVKPDIIINLAAQSSVFKSWLNPVLTMNINVNGTLNILEVIKEYHPEIRFLCVGSAEEYGNNDDMLKESFPLKPENIYGISKMTQELLCNAYIDRYDLDIVLTRSFNHFGPKQLDTFVIADFCNQVAKIENGLQEAVIKVGNLQVYRDFTDVRDIVNAYLLIIQNGTRGEVYNVGSGNAISIQKMLEMIVDQAKVSVKVVVDPSKVRKVDVPYICANVEFLTNRLGWKQQYNISDTIRDTLEYFRRKYQ